MVLQPTHTCFDDALEFLNCLLLRPYGRDALLDHTLVHAICMAPNGQEYAHAWLETGDIVIFAGLVEGERVYFYCDREEYYKAYCVIQSTSYTAIEAMNMNLAHANLGPWEPQYKNLSGKGSSVLGATNLRARPIGGIP